GGPAKNTLGGSGATRRLASEYPTTPKRTAAIEPDSTRGCHQSPRRDSPARTGSDGGRRSPSSANLSTTVLVRCPSPVTLGQMNRRRRKTRSRSELHRPFTPDR